MSVLDCSFFYRYLILFLLYFSFFCYKKLFLYTFEAKTSYTILLNIMSKTGIYAILMPLLFAGSLQSSPRNQKARFYEVRVANKSNISKKHMSIYIDKLATVQMLLDGITSIKEVVKAEDISYRSENSSFFTLPSAKYSEDTTKSIEKVMEEFNSPQKMKLYLLANFDKWPNNDDCIMIDSSGNIGYNNASGFRRLSKKSQFYKLSIGTNPTSIMYVNKVVFGKSVSEKIPNDVDKIDMTILNKKGTLAIQKDEIARDEETIEKIVADKKIDPHPFSMEEMEEDIKELGKSMQYTIIDWDNRQKKIVLPIEFYELKFSSGSFEDLFIYIEPSAYGEVLINKWKEFEKKLGINNVTELIYTTSGPNRDGKITYNDIEKGKNKSMEDILSALPQNEGIGQASKVDLKKEIINLKAAEQEYAIIYKDTPRVLFQEDILYTDRIETPKANKKEGFVQLAKKSDIIELQENNQIDMSDNSKGNTVEQQKWSLTTISLFIVLLTIIGAPIIWFVYRYITSKDKKKSIRSLE